MKTIKLLCILLLGFSAMAQNFTLIGERDFGTLFDWDVPRTSTTYTSQDGTIYAYVTESSQPRTNELIRYNEGSDSWENITNNTFLIDGNASVSHGTGMTDGSVYTITRSFSGSHFAHRIMPDGTIQEIGDLSSTDNANSFKISSGINPLTEEFYYIHSGSGVRAVRFDGTQWVQLPDAEAVNTSGVENVDMDFDELGNLYATYRGGDTSRVRVTMFDGTNWTNIYTSAVSANSPTIQVVSSTEIYLTLITNSNSTLEVFFYDGTSFSPFGSAISIPERDNSILRTSDGEVFLATESANGFYHFNVDDNDWEIIPNDIQDNSSISGTSPRLLESNGFIYNTFSNIIGVTTVRYNGDQVLSTNDAQTENNNLFAFPNPASNAISIGGASLVGQDLRVTIFDLNGREVVSKEVNSTNNTISVSQLATSSYIVVLENENNEILKRLHFVKR